MVDWKRVGVLPKSLSTGPGARGNNYELTTDRSVVRKASSPIAKFPAFEQFECVPVLTQSIPVAWSMLGVSQIPPPTQPVGTVLKVCRTAPVEAFTCTSCPCTSGQSP